DYLAPTLDIGEVGVADGDLAFSTGLEERAVDHLCRATDVERAHGELGAGFTDGLSGNNADSFTDIDRRTACKVTTIAGGAATLAKIAGQRRTDADRLDTRLFDHVDMLF